MTYGEFLKREGLTHTPEYFWFWLVSEIVKLRAAQQKAKHLNLKPGPRKTKMIDKDMIFACVVARLQADKKVLEDVSQDELSIIVKEAIDGLVYASELLNKEMKNDLG